MKKKCVAAVAFFCAVTLSGCTAPSLSQSEVEICGLTQSWLSHGADVQSFAGHYVPTFDRHKDAEFNSTEVKALVLKIANSAADDGDVIENATKLHGVCVGLGWQPTEG